MKFCTYQFRSKLLRTRLQHVDWYSDSMEFLKATCMSMIFIVLSFCLQPSVIRGEENSIGVNYGTVGDNLPSPTDVVAMYRQNNINKMRIFSPDPAILQALEAAVLMGIRCFFCFWIFSHASSMLYLPCGFGFFDTHFWGGSFTPWLGNRFYVSVLRPFCFYRGGRDSKRHSPSWYAKHRLVFHRSGRRFWSLAGSYVAKVWAPVSGGSGCRR